MPIHSVKQNGKVIGYKWGKRGKLYTVKEYGLTGSRFMVINQAKAIYASGYKKETIRKHRKDGHIQRYHIRRK